MNRLFTRSGLIASGIVLAVLAGMISVWLSWADLFRTHLVNFAHESFFVLGPLLICLALIVPAVLVFRAGGRNPRRPSEYDFGYTDVGRQALKAAMAKYEERKARAQRIHTATNVVGGLLVLATVVALGFTIKFWVTHSYNVDREYNAGLQVVKTAMPTYAQRPAQPVAAASEKGNLPDGIVGDLDTSRFVAANGSDSWNNLVESPAMWGGYTAVEVQHLGLTGVGSADACRFNTTKAARSIGGSFTHSLERAIAAVHSGAKINDGDAYGACVGGKPLVVVPLTRQVGWWYSHEVPDGVAVYDGLTGKVTYLAHVTAGQLPGPVYPISLAQKQREASAATGSFSDYWNDRTGFEDTSSDSGDPNGDNRAEFSLRKVDGGASYVTPLTPRRNATGIIAVGVLDNDTVTAGRYTHFVVHQLPVQRKANSTVAQRIRGDYGDLPEWASHMEIFEITPVGPDTWVASLGQSQDINYRVLVQANGDSCLERADGAKLRCGKVTGTNGNGVGVALAPGSAGSVPVPAAGGLAKLSNAQLLELQQQITAELGSRLSTK